MDVTMVAAVARNGVIGNAGDIPWDLPADQQRFKALTMGGTLVMGRRTFDSIGRPLPGRRSVVLTRDPGWHRDGVSVVHDIADALDRPGGVFVIGGGDVYRLAMPYATRLEITEVDLEPTGDATFPTIDPDRWTVTARVPQDGYTYLTYEPVR